MRSSILGVGVGFALLAASPALAASTPQPPMNNFNDAYYTCDAGGAFLMSYDSTKPTSATMTTSNNSKRYMLKRDRVATGVQFAGDKVKFWTDGKTVTVEGTEIPLQNCAVKAG
jgi:membrane-bound inhibitor of C-type lysozyme